MIVRREARCSARRSALRFRDRAERVADRRVVHRDEVDRSAALPLTGVRPLQHPLPGVDEPGVQPQPAAGRDEVVEQEQPLVGAAPIRRRQDISSGLRNANGVSMPLPVEFGTTAPGPSAFSANNQAPSAVDRVAQLRPRPGPDRVRLERQVGQAGLPEGALDRHGVNAVLEDRVTTSVGLPQPVADLAQRG